MKKWTIGLLSIIGLCCFLNAYAETHKLPTGLWRTNRSILKIYTVNDELRAKAVKILAGKGNAALCKNCKGVNKDKPLVGLTMIWGLKPAGNNKWTGGEGIDPDTGNTYQCSLELSENGQVIRFHASRFLFERTLEWHRVTSL